MSSILQLSLEWKPAKLPQLIDHIKEIVELQYTDMKRTLYGQGNLNLAPWARKFRMIPQVWLGKQIKNFFFFKFW